MFTRKATAWLLAALITITSLAAPTRGYATEAIKAGSADDILNKVVIGWLTEGRTTFVFDQVPNMYETAYDVSKRLPVATLPYAKNYGFDWGNGSQIVLRFNSAQAERDQQAYAAVQQQGKAIAASTNDPNLRFKKAFSLVANSVTYIPTSSLKAVKNKPWPPPFSTASPTVTATPRG